MYDIIIHLSVDLYESPELRLRLRSRKFLHGSWKSVQSPPLCISRSGLKCKGCEYDMCMLLIVPFSCPRNIVSTVNLDCKLDLKQIALHARNAEYNPKVCVHA